MALGDPNWVNIIKNEILHRCAYLKWGVFSHGMSENFHREFKIEYFGMNTLFTEPHAFYRHQTFLFFDDSERRLAA